MSARRSRKARQTLRDQCRDCDQPGTHLLVDPVMGSRFVACDDHWPDLAAMIFSLGGWVSACPCPECIGLVST